METPYKVPLTLLDDYQYIRVPINAAEDKWIQAIQIRPGNTEVVHHIGAIIAPHNTAHLSGIAATAKLYGLSGEKIQKVGDYVPGDPFNARIYQEGHALKLPKNHDIIFELHYTPTGKPDQYDQSSM